MSVLPSVAGVNLPGQFLTDDAVEVLGDDSEIEGLDVELRARRGR